MNRFYDYSIDWMNESDGSEITLIMFKEDVPYIMDFTSTKYDFEKNQEQITGYIIYKVINNFLVFTIYKWDCHNQV